MANIKACSFGLGLVLVSMVSTSALAVPMIFERIFPDTKITRVKTEYDASEQLFTQRTRFPNTNEDPATSALYRQTIGDTGDNITDLEWNLRATVDNDGNYVEGTGSFSLFGAVDFEDPTKTDIVVPQLLLSGGIAAFGVGVFENVFPNGAITPISYNIIGLTVYSAPGFDYGGYLGMIWTDDPTPLADGSARSNNQELFGSDWESEESNVTRAQADIFLVPAPSSILLFGLAMLAMVRSKRR